MKVNLPEHNQLQGLVWCKRLHVSPIILGERNLCSPPSGVEQGALTFLVKSFRPGNWSRVFSHEKTFQTKHEPGVFSRGEQTLRLRRRSMRGSRRRCAAQTRPTAEGSHVTRAESRDQAHCGRQSRYESGVTTVAGVC